jgi:transposase-like protein
VNADPKYCPDPKCKFGTGEHVGFFRRRGSYSTKCRPTPTPRFQCKGCGKVFSSQSTAPSRYHRRPDINAVLARLLCEGVTLRGCARVLGCTYDTVQSKADWLAVQARKAHQKALESGRLNTSWMQLDEMMTFEHARARTLTIPLVVRGKTAEILAMTVGRIPSSGHLATKGKTMYGWTVNEAPAACRKALEQASVAAKEVCTVSCDKATSYPKLVVATIPHAVVRARKRAKGKGTGNFDPMFSLNHTCAKIRAGVAVMARKTWTTTKSIQKLQDKLDIFIAVHNGYEFC